MDLSCSTCGTPIPKVDFLRPMTLEERAQEDAGTLPDDFQRSPLCEPCWNQAYESQYGHAYKGEAMFVAKFIYDNAPEVK